MRVAMSGWGPRRTTRRGTDRSASPQRVRGLGSSWPSSCYPSRRRQRGCGAGVRSSTARCPAASAAPESADNHRRPWRGQRWHGIQLGPCSIIMRRSVHLASSACVGRLRPAGRWSDRPGGKGRRGMNAVELTDAVRARYRDSVAKLSLPPHGTFPINVDEIVGPAPVSVRLPIPRPGGRERGR